MREVHKNDCHKNHSFIYDPEFTVNQSSESIFIFDIQSYALVEGLLRKYEGRMKEYHEQ